MNRENMENEEIARFFSKVADLLELKGENPFRVRAYRQAAWALENHPEPVAPLALHNEERLLAITGIGKDLADKIKTIVSTATLPLLEELEEVLPPGLPNLLKIPTLGPKRVNALWKKLGVTSLSELKRAAEGERIRELRGFGAKTEEAILRGIALLDENLSRLPLDRAAKKVQMISSHIESVAGLEKFVAAGSYRRRKETVGDLDILAVTGRPDALITKLQSLPELERMEAAGNTRLTIRERDGFRIDVRIVPARSFGAALVYFTGSKEHNIHIRRIAIGKGLKVNEYGVFRDEKYLGGKSEKDVYDAVGLPWIEPELREDRGEIEAAAENRLPRLVERSQIKGDLHVHSNESMGLDAIKRIADAALANNYAYIAITDGAPPGSKDWARRRLRRQWEEIENLRASYPALRILKGVEAGILGDGRLDIPDDVLNQADWVVAALRSNFDQEESGITRRLVQAIRNPYVNMIAHPLGRLIGERESLSYDFELFCKEAAAHDCILEINGDPRRLDLNDLHIMTAARYGVTFAVCSDAYSIDALSNMTYAVEQARRGWLSADAVVNTKRVYLSVPTQGDVASS